MATKGSKRIYHKRIVKYLAVTGITVPTIIGIFLYLSAIGAITITSYSGDSYCFGTDWNNDGDTNDIFEIKMKDGTFVNMSERCYAYINFSANTDIFLYANESWEFYTDVPIQEIKMYRSWGSGWRYINMTKPCTGTWCGAPDNTGNVKYSVAFRKGKDYQIKFETLRNDIFGDIKWGFESIDPTWHGIQLNDYSSDDFFVKLIKTQGSIGSGYALFTFQTQSWDMEINKDTFYATLENRKGKDGTITSIKILNVPSTTICETKDGKDFDRIVYEDIEIMNGKTIILPKNSKFDVEVRGKWAIGFSNDKEWIPVVNISGKSFKHSEWGSWAFELDYATEINISVDGFTYAENQTPITRWIDFSSLDVIPYNESMRVASGRCNEGGVELPSAFVPWTQNASGHVTLARAVIIPNGTVNSDISYCIYYNYTKVDRFDYTTDLKVKANNITNTHVSDFFTGGLITTSQYISNSDNGNNAGGNGIEGLHRTGANVLVSSVGTCIVKYNFSMLVVMNCSVTEGGVYTEMLHYYPAYSPMKQMQIRTPWSTISLYNFGTPNNTAGASTAAPFNTTTTSEGYYDPLTRGQCGAFLDASNIAYGIVYNTTRNQTVIRYSANSFVGCQPMSANQAGSDIYGNMSFITRAYVTGSTSQSKIDNLTNYWGLYIANQDEILVNPTQTKPSDPIIVTILKPTNTTYSKANQSLDVTTSATEDTRWYTNDRGLTEYCYQEFANVSTSCGGLSTGVYGWTFNDTANWTNPNNAIDGNWSTATAPACYNISYFYINYTKPQTALSSSKWQIKDVDATINLSMLPNCWSQNPLQFRVKLNGAGCPIATSNEIQWSCYNGTEYETIRSRTSDSNRFYEEAMYWNVSSKVIFTDNTTILLGLGANNITVYVNDSSGTEYKNSVVASYVTLPDIYLNGVKSNTTYELGTVSTIRANISNTDVEVCLSLDAFGFGENFTCANQIVEYNFTTISSENTFWILNNSYNSKNHTINTNVPSVFFFDIDNRSEFSTGQFNIISLVNNSKNVGIDVGLDGITDYKLLGNMDDSTINLDYFDINTTMKNVTFNYSGIEIITFTLPRNVTVTEANMTIDSLDSGTMTTNKIMASYLTSYILNFTGKENEENNLTFKLLIPKGSTILSASLNLTGSQEGNYFVDMRGNPTSYWKEGTLQNPEYVFDNDTSTYTSVNHLAGENLYADFNNTKLPNATSIMVAALHITCAITNTWDGVSKTSSPNTAPVWYSLDTSHGKDGSIRFFDTGDQNCRNIAEAWLTFNYTEYPDDIRITIDKKSPDTYNMSGSLDYTQNVTLNISQIQTYIDSCTDDLCYVPFQLFATGNGVVNVSSVRVTYSNTVSNLTIDTGDDRNINYNYTGIFNSTNVAPVTIDLGISDIQSYLDNETLCPTSSLDCAIPIRIGSQSAGGINITWFEVNYTYNKINVSSTPFINFSKNSCWKNKGDYEWNFENGFADIYHGFNLSNNSINIPNGLFNKTAEFNGINSSMNYSGSSLCKENCTITMQLSMKSYVEFSESMNLFIINNETSNGVLIGISEKGKNVGFKATYGNVSDDRKVRFLNTSTSHEEDVFRHFALTIEKVNNTHQDFTGYYNGIAIDTSYVKEMSPLNIENITIGSYFLSYVLEYEFLNGTIGELKIFNRTLTSHEIKFDAFSSPYETNRCKIPIEITSETNTTININNMFLKYKGTANHTVFASTQSNKSIDLNLDVVWSKWNYSFPNATQYFEFIPNTPTSKNVTPYGQTSDDPILNITPQAWDNLFNFSIYLNDSYNCVNLTVSTDNSKANGSIVTKNSWSEHKWNQTETSPTFGLWFWSDYYCSGTTQWYLWQPYLSLRACGVGTICSADVT